MASEGYPREISEEARYHNRETQSRMNINSWLEDELYQQYLHDHGAVDESWKSIFEQHAPAANGSRLSPRRPPV